MRVLFTALLLAVFLSTPGLAAVEDGPATVGNGRAHVAVVDFEDLTGQDLGASVAENFRTALAGGGAYSVIERGQLEKVLREQKLSASDMTDAGSASRVGKLLDADYVAVGSIVRLGRKYTINVRFVDVATSETVRAGQASGSSLDEFDEMVDALVTACGGRSTMVTTTGLPVSPGDTIYANDFTVPDLGGMEVVGSGVYSINSKERVLTLGDGDGDGDEMRAGIYLRDENLADYEVSFDMRYRRGGSFGVYARTGEDAAVLALAITGDRFPPLQLHELGPAVYDKDAYYHGYPKSLTPEVEGEPDPGDMLAAAVVASALSIAYWPYYWAHHDDYDDYDFNPNANYAYNELDEDVWYSVKLKLEGDKVKLAFGGTRLDLDLDEADSGGFFLAVFDDCIVDIKDLEVTAL
jgi:TolB-like protein